MQTLAVLMTCHNRKEKTLSCIQSIFESKIDNGIEIKIYVVDDGSTDGTYQAIQKQFPQVVLIRGDGNLFWNKGMHLAFANASKRDYDFYLWLNDDTMLFVNSISTALKTWYECYNKYNHENNIIIGTTRDPMNPEITTYGGVKKLKGLHPFRFGLIQVSEEIQLADTFNGNIVLISRSVYKKVGLNDEQFVHSTGDFDYGLRAKKVGCNIIVAPGFLGECSRNPPPRYKCYRDRVKRVFSKKGLPFRDWSIYCIRHGGALWPLWAIVPYIRMLVFRKD